MIPQVNSWVERSRSECAAPVFLFGVPCVCVPKSPTRQGCPKSSCEGTIAGAMPILELSPSFGRFTDQTKHDALCKRQAAVPRTV
jgi:hypothetical protein